MNNTKKVSLLGNEDDSLPIVVQNPLRTSGSRINEDYADGYPGYGYGSAATHGGPKNHSKVYQLFVQPFVDVLRTFKFAAMQFSNSLKLMWKIFTVFDIGEFEDEVDMYNERRQAINKQWEPLKQKISDQIDRTDPVFAISVIGPEFFFANKAFKAGFEAGKPVAEILTATGWEQLRDNFKTDFDPNENLNKNSARIQKNQKKLLKKLNRLFFTTQGDSGSFYESVENNEDLLIEEAQAPVEDMSPEEKIKKFLQVSGLQDEMDQTKIEISENILAIVPKLQKMLIPLDYSSEILAAKNFQEFSDAVKKIQASGGKINLPLQQISQELETNAKKLASNEEFQKKLSGSKNEAADEKQPAKIDEKKVLEQARITIFNDSKEDLNMKVMQQLKAVLPKIEKKLSEIAISDKILSKMEDDKFAVVKRAAKVYKSFIDSYKKIQENYSTAT